MVNSNNKLLLLIVIGIFSLTPSSSYSRNIGINDFTEKRISTLQRYIYNVYDFFIGELIALTDVSEDTERFVRKIQHQMEMDHVTIRLRSMSRAAMSSMGRENAAAVSIPLANTIIISEEWFNSLPEPERQALIGHELAHIKNKHSSKQMCVSMLSYLIPRMLGFKHSSAPLMFIISSLYSQYCELEADKASALECDNIDGVINLFKHFKSIKDPHSRFALKRWTYKLLKKITYPVRKLLATHPSLNTRIKNIKSLKTA